MNKLIAALFCCSVDSREPLPKSASALPASRLPDPKPLSHTSAANNDDSLSRKDVLDDDHSANEADTITNTNDLRPTPVLASTSAIIASVPEVSPLDSANELTPLNDEESLPSENLSSSTCIDESDLENDMLFDLSKLQDGQSFHPDTGLLLPPKDPSLAGKKCLVLDLDETLVHSSFKYLRSADFVIPVEIDNVTHHVYVIKRPGVDEFLKTVGKLYEVVIFTASVSKYGHPLLDKLDVNHTIHHRLFRDSCYNYQGNYIKNLSQVGRPLLDLIIIDNSPASYIFHPQHLLPISSWFSDTHDNELLDLLPVLEDLAQPIVQDVSLVLDVSL